MSGRVAVVAAPGPGEAIEGRAGAPPTFKVRDEQTGNALTAFEHVIAPTPLSHPEVC
jgi:hypothetical protein